MGGDVLTPAQAGRVLDLSARYVSQLGDEGRLEMTRTPLGRLFSANDVERFAAERRAVLEVRSAA